MENKKEIGKIFRDRLEHLDKSPSNNLWNSIESDLNKKRKRRLLFWLIPSLLLIGIASSIFFLTSKQDVKQLLNVQQDKTINQKQSEDLKTKAVSGGKSITEKSTESKTTFKKTKTEKLIKQSSTLIATTDEYEEYEVIKKYKVIIRKNKTVTTTQKTNSIFLKTDKPLTKTNKNTSKAVTFSKKQNIKSDKKHSKKSYLKKKTAIPKNEIDSISKKQNQPIKIEGSQKDNSLQDEIPNKEKVEDADNQETIKLDSIDLKQEKKTTPKREYIKREYPEQISENEPEYSVSVYYGPAIFGSVSNKSTLNESFDDVSKSHPVTSHFGIYFKSMYGKYGFKAGISKINLKISNHLNPQSSINYDNMVLTNNAIYNVMANDQDIRLIQKISYYEIPLEFNYAVKKDDTPYGLEAFTGFSVLISDANQLYLSSNNLKSEGIGSTKDLNKMNLSLNLGLGTYYKLNDKFEVFLNPIFKYYLTTFKKYDEPKPYSLSIQSGVNYKF